MNTTYITPELIAQAQELIDKGRDYNFTASLPEGMALYSYSDGVWVVDTKDSCNMEDATKIECVIAINPAEDDSEAEMDGYRQARKIRLEFIRLAELNVTKNKHRYASVLDIEKLASILSVAELQAKIEKMRADYIGTKLEKFL